MKPLVALLLGLLLVGAAGQRLRLVHTVPSDRELPIRFTLEGDDLDTIDSLLVFSDATPLRTVEPGRYRAALVSERDPDRPVTVARSTLQVDEDAVVNAIAVGSQDNVDLVQVTLDQFPDSEETSRITVLHAYLGVGEVDIFITPYREPLPDEPDARIAYKQVTTVVVPAGAYDIRVIDPRSGEVLFYVGATSLPANNDIIAAAVPDTRDGVGLIFSLNDASFLLFSQDPPTPTPAPSSSAAPSDEAEVCVGVATTLGGRPLVEQLPATARVQTHPRLGGRSVAKVLCAEVHGERVCLTATHVVVWGGEHMYMREACAKVVLCGEEEQEVFNAKTEDGVLASYGGGEVRVTHHAASGRVARRVSAWRVAQMERYLQKYAGPLWRALSL